MAETKDLFTRLKKMFSTDVIVRNVGGKRIKVIDTDNLQFATDRNSLRDRYNRLRSSTYNLHNRDMSMAYQAARLELFRDYDVMDSDPILASALDIYADECLVPSEYGNILTISSSNENIKKILENLFYDILNIEFNLWSWTRNMCKYGDFFLRLEISPEYGIFLVQPISPYELTRIEGSDPNNLNYVKYQHDGLGGGMEYESFEIAHFRLLSDSNFLPYGKCLAGDTFVDTEYGAKFIKNINVGEKVYTFNTSTVKMELANVLNKVCSGTKEMLRIYTQHNFVDASKEHPILFFDRLTKTFNYKKAEDVRIGDLLIINANKEKKFKSYVINKVISEDKTCKSDRTEVDNIPTVADEEFCDDAIILDPVREIEDVGEKETYDIQINSINSNFVANGIVVHNSMIEPARRVWKQLSLSEDAMLIHRIMRAPEKRIFKIDVGNIPPSEIDAAMQKIISQVKKVPYIDERTGDYNLRFNLNNMVEDFYLPVRGGDSGTSIDTLPGMEFTGIDDLEYIRNKMMAALKIPRAFLGYEENISGKATLASEDVRFSRTIGRIQRILISELVKIAVVHLYVQGYQDASLVDFSLELSNPSTIFEQEKLEIWQNKINVAKDMMETSLFSRKWIYDKVFKIANDEIEDLETEVIKDKKEEWRRQQITDEGNDPISSGQKASEAGMSDLGGGGAEEPPPDLGETGAEPELPPLEEKKERERDQTGNKEKYQDVFEKNRGEDYLGNKENKEKSKSDRSIKYNPRPVAMREELKSIKKALDTKYSRVNKAVIAEGKSLLDESNLIGVNIAKKKSTINEKNEVTLTEKKSMLDESNLIGVEKPL
jgi:hypothetical protein